MMCLIGMPEEQNMRYDPDNLPEYNEAIMCPDCGEKSDVIVGLYGMFGGGDGPYTMCSDCGKIISKSFSSDSHENKKPIIDTTATEIDNGQESAATDKGSKGN